ENSAAEIDDDYAIHADGVRFKAMRACRHNRFSEGRRVAELSHQAQSIPADERVQDLSVDDVMDRDSMHEYLLIRGRNSFVPAFVSAGNHPGDNQLVLFGKNVFDGEMQIGKSRSKPDYLLFVTVRTCLRAR